MTWKERYLSKNLVSSHSFPSMKTFKAFESITIMASEPKVLFLSQIEWKMYSLKKVPILDKTILRKSKEFN